MKFIFVSLLLFLLCAQCSQKKEYNGVLICKEFYELNKNNDLTSFGNKEVLTIREYSDYNYINQRIDRVPLIILVSPEKDSIIGIPTYRKDANILEREAFFKRCDTTTLKYIMNKYKTNDNSNNLFEAYQIEVDSFYLEYSKIIVPKELPYNNP